MGGLSLRGDGLEDVRVSGVDDGHHRDTEVLTAGSAEVVVGARVVVDVSLGEHRVVLDLRLDKRGCVGRKENKTSLSATERTERRLVSQPELSGLHHQSEVRVDRLGTRCLSRGSVTTCTRKQRNERCATGVVIVVV